MKTPRDILLAQHRAAEPKLDAIRRAVVVAELNNQVTKEQGWAQNLVPWFLGCSNLIWSELIWPSRRIWAGLAAVWVVIAIVNVSQRDNSSPVMAQSAPSPQMMLSLRQQERLLAELIGPSDALVAEPLKAVLPRPRSELRLEMFAT